MKQQAANTHQCTSRKCFFSKHSTCNILQNIFRTLARFNIVLQAGRNDIQCANQ